MEKIKPGYAPVYNGITGEFIEWKKQPDDKEVIYFIQFPKKYVHDINIGAWQLYGENKINCNE